MGCINEPVSCPEGQVCNVDTGACELGCPCWNKDEIAEIDGVGINGETETINYYCEIYGQSQDNMQIYFGEYTDGTGIYDEGIYINLSYQGSYIGCSYDKNYHYKTFRRDTHAADYQLTIDEGNSCLRSLINNHCSP